MKIVYSNGTITPEEVVGHLALTGQADTIYQGIIIQKEAARKAKELKISVFDEELQQFSDNFRATHGLITAEETYRYLKDSGLTEDDFEAFCESSLLTFKLKEHLAGENNIKDFFFTHQTEFDRARVSTIIIGEENLAREIKMQVTEDEEDFQTLARQYSLDAGSKHAGGYIELITRNTFSPEVTAKVFNASSGDLLGPFQKDGLFQLIFIVEVKRAELNDDVKDTIKQRIFEEWGSQILKKGIRIDL